MSSIPILETGGAIPGGGEPPTASTLLVQFNALSDADKAAFRALLAPRHNNVENEAGMLALTDRRAGDTCSRGDDFSLYQFNGGDETDLSDWELLFAPPE